MNENNPLRRQPVRTPATYSESDAEASHIMGKRRSAVQDAEQALWGSTDVNGHEPAFKGGPDYVAPSQRKRKAPVVTIGWAEPLYAAIPSWRMALGSPALDKAVKEALAKIDVAEKAADAFKSLAEDQRRETAAIIEAAKAGLSKEIDRTDWEVEAAIREQSWADAYADAQKAASRCRAVTSSETAKRLPQLVAYAAEKRAAALKKAKAAHDDIVLAIAATTAIREADKALGLTPKGWHRTTQDKVNAPGDARNGLAAVLRYLDTDDEMISGKYVLDTSATVPMHTREYLASRPSGSHEEHTLFQIEASEHWSVTDHTKGLKSVYAIDPEWKSAWLDKRELPR